MKFSRPIFIASILIALASLGYVAYQMFWGPDRIDLIGKSLPELLDNGGLLGLIVIPVVLLIGILVMRPFLRIMFPDEIKGGVTAPAKVLKVWDTGVSINNNPQVGLLLEITPTDGVSFQAESKTVVSRLQAALVQPGATAEVRYDPQKPQRLQVLNLTLPSPGASNTETRLEELTRLRERGLITAEEYIQKRDQILKDL